MADDFGGDFIQITDEDGQEYELEYLDSVELDGVTYMAFLPADVDEDDDEYGIVLMRVVEENGEDMLETLEDDALRDTVYEAFMAILFDDEDDDGTPVQ